MLLVLLMPDYSAPAKQRPTIVTPLDQADRFQTCRHFPCGNGRSGVGREICPPHIQATRGVSKHHIGRQLDVDAQNSSVPKLVWPVSRPKLWLALAANLSHAG